MNMRKLLLCLVVPALLALPAHASSGELKLSIKGGLVTLVAEDVPLSMIMAEWARIGQTRIVNGDKILTPVSLQLVDVPERKALDILLRSASGYMLAERPTPVANASAFDRILILPTSKPPAYTGPANPVPAPFMPPRPIPAQPMPDMDTQPEVNPNAPPPLPPGVQPGMQPPMPTQPGQPGGPLTAPRPGQLPAPVPQQPVPFGAPPRPPGSGGRGGGPGGR
jgi:hypothetical protein